jgi:hypothetical protein
MRNFRFLLDCPFWVKKQTKFIEKKFELVACLLHYIFAVVDVVPAVVVIAVARQ